MEEVFVAQGELWELRWQGRTIRTTAEHPFYVFELGWTPARDLRPGMLLATLDGRYLPLESIASTGRTETVYNFRIADGHTYFVGTPEWNAALWAHNACLHHSDPKFMGGAANQMLTRMSVKRHQALHRDLNAFLVKRTDAFGNHMRPQSGNSGKKIRRNFTREERLEALADFYHEHRRYSDAARDFFKQHPSLK